MEASLTMSPNGNLLISGIIFVNKRTLPHLTAVWTRAAILVCYTVLAKLKSWSKLLQPIEALQGFAGLLRTFSVYLDLNNSKACSLLRIFVYVRRLVKWWLISLLRWQNWTRIYLKVRLKWLLRATQYLDPKECSYKSVSHLSIGPLKAVSAVMLQSQLVDPYTSDVLGRNTLVCWLKLRFFRVCFWSSLQPSPLQLKNLDKFSRKSGEFFKAVMIFQGVHK